jgi:hypothetical protein
MKRILIYVERVSSPSGRMYLCADGSLCSERSDAAEFWDIQFDAVLSENWLVRGAKMEVVL